VSPPAHTASRLGSGAMFDGIAARYDVMNRVMSFGIDKDWRRRAVAELDLAAGGSRTTPRRVLDLATGTGDLAIAICRSHAGASVVGVDPSSGMLAVGKKKADDEGLSDRIQLLEAEAEQLPFDDASFDAVSIAFGIRNVADRPRGLREMCRVTRPGGRVVILELSEPRAGLMSSLAKLHVRHVVPLLGSLIGGKREYGYLQASIAAFPAAEEFAAMIGEAGLEVLRVTPLTMGVAHLFVGRAKVVA